MVLAYLQLNKIVTHDNPGDLFIQLLKFYGKDFNPKKQGIWPNLIQWYTFSQHSTDFRCPIFEFQAPNESVPLVLLDPTSFMIVNLAIKSEMAPVAFKKFAELHDSLISFKQEMAKQTAKQTSDLPRNILAKLVLGMDL